MSAEEGDISGVTAGIGLSGGGTTGTVSLALDVSELSALGGTAESGDYLVIQDSTDDSTKKVLVSNLPGTGNSFSTISEREGCMYHFIVEFIYFSTCMNSGDNLN